MKIKTLDNENNNYFMYKCCKRLLNEKWRFDGHILSRYYLAAYETNSVRESVHVCVRERESVCVP